MRDRININEAYQEISPGVVKWIDDDDTNYMDEVQCHSDTSLDYVVLRISNANTVTPNFLHVDITNTTPQAIILRHTTAGMYHIRGKVCNRALVFATPTTAQLVIYLPPIDDDPLRFTNIITTTFLEIIQTIPYKVIAIIDEPKMAGDLLDDYRIKGRSMYHLLAIWFRELSKCAVKMSLTTEGYQEISPGVVKWVDDDITSDETRGIYIVARIYTDPKNFGVVYNLRLMSEGEYTRSELIDYVNDPSAPLTNHIESVYPEVIEGVIATKPLGRTEAVSIYLRTDCRTVPAEDFVGVFSQIIRGVNTVNMLTHSKKTSIDTFTKYNLWSTWKRFINKVCS